MSFFGMPSCGGTEEMLGVSRCPGLSMMGKGGSTLNILICSTQFYFYVDLLVYSNFRKYAHSLHVKEGIITEKVFPVFSESFFLDLFWLSHVHLGVNGCHRKVGLSNVKK